MQFSSTFKTDTALWIKSSIAVFVLFMGFHDWSGKAGAPIALIVLISLLNGFVLGPLVAIGLFSIPSIVIGWVIQAISQIVKHRKTA